MIIFNNDDYAQQVLNVVGRQSNGKLLLTNATHTTNGTAGVYVFQFRLKDDNDRLTLKEMKDLDTWCNEDDNNTQPKASYVYYENILWYTQPYLN